MNTRHLAGALALGATFLLTGCGGEGAGRQDIVVSGGDPERGRDAIVRYGCTSCHAVPDVASVDNDYIAPDLEGFDDRYYIAGQISNRPEELIRWLQNPQDITPGIAMPDLGVTEQDARDIAAYLYGR